MNCKNCNKIIPQISGKKQKLFCDDSCRMAYNRRLKSEQVNPNKTKSEQPKSEQIKSEHQIRTSEPKHPQKYPDGQCQGCGEKQPSPLVDICYKCIEKGMTRESLGLKEIKIKDEFKPNWQKLKIKESRRIDYVLYFLKQSEKKIGNAVFAVGNKILEVGRKKEKTERVMIPLEFRE